MKPKPSLLLLLLYSGGGFLRQFLTAKKNLHGKTHTLVLLGFEWSKMSKTVTRYCSQWTGFFEESIQLDALTLFNVARRPSTQSWKYYQSF